MTEKQSIIPFEEYTRVWKNFDSCMACIMEIMEIAAKQNNIEIGKRVESLLNEIIPPDEKSLK